MTNNDKEGNSQEEQPVESKGENKPDREKLNWIYCPGCGIKLLEIKNLKYCINCGLDLYYVQEHRELPPIQSNIQYQAAEQYSPYPSYYPQYKPYREKLSDEDVKNTKDRELWGLLPSLGLPMLAFIAMNVTLIGILVVLVFFSFSLSDIINIVYNPLFLVFSSIIELILILLPILYVSKYLQRPSIKNRFKLLGFTTEGYSGTGVLKEVLLGLGFAVVGLFLVGIVALATESMLEFVFGIEIIQSGSEGPGSDVEYLISSADIIVLVLMVIIMLTVVGTSEEILFRGFMQRGLVRKLGQTGGILITAFIFAMIHLIALFLIFDNFFTLFILFVLFFMPYFAISLMLGLLFKWRDENLITVIITHGVYNSITVIIAFTYYLPFEVFYIIFLIIMILMASSFILYFILNLISTQNDSNRILQ